MSHRFPFKFSLFESLESRQFLSASIKSGLIIPATDFSRAHPKSKIAYTQYQITASTTSAKTAKDKKTKSKLTPSATYSSPVGKTPAQIRNAYGVSSILFNSIVGDGAGQTIAIIDAYDDPSMVSSTNSNFLISDLHRFDVQFNLPDPPSFTKVSQTGSQSRLPSYNSGWATEIALDVEWAHAMAPGASILLVEASSSSTSNLNTAVKYARNQSNVSVITMSYGQTEYSGETSNDSIYTTPSGHTPITYFSSTGDAGSPGDYQAYSPNIVAVGGTSLYLNSSGNYSSESGWSGSGGGISQYESKPSYQSSVTQSTTKRTTPDVSAVADPNTGVAVLDSSAGGIGSSSGWQQIGGTSLSSPLWAGLMSIVDQGRNLLGLSTLNGASQTLPDLYNLNSSDFHDVTTGSNGGFSASAGYDLVTGRGSPVANQLVPDLAGGATIAGTVFSDDNADGLLDDSESPISNVTLYLDLNNNGVKDSTEPSAITDASGDYSFSDLLGRISYVVREVLPGGYISTTSNALSLSSLYDTTTTGDFGLTTPPLTAFTSQSLTLRLDSTGTQLQVFSSSSGSDAPISSQPVALLSSLSFTGTGNNDLLTIDLSNGNPLAGLNVSYDGGDGADSVSILGTTAADTAVFSNTAITIDGITLNLSNTESASFDGAGGYDTLSVTGSNPLTLAPNQQLQSLSLSNHAAVTLPAGQNTLYTRSLSLDSTATLNLTDGTLIDDDSTQGFTSATLLPLLHSAYNSGLWTGAGLTSSSAASDANHLTALGYLTAADLGVSSYNGQSVSPSAVIIKYTYCGDATLNGKVDSDDIILADLGRAKNKSTWLYGDFNYDGVINDADSTLQLQPLQAAPALLA